MIMNCVYYFSGTGHSLTVASYFSDKLKCKSYNICDKNNLVNECETAVVVFPVYCQDVPSVVKEFLKNLSSKYVVLIATYGRVYYGNVLHIAQKLAKGEVIAAACVPTGHTYLPEDYSFDTEPLNPIIERIYSPIKVSIPVMKNDFWAGLFPNFRSRISVKIVKNDFCNNCGVCSKNCPVGAIKDNKITSECIRCLHCVKYCPEKALSFKISGILKRYLDRHNYRDFVIIL